MDDSLDNSISNKVSQILCILYPLKSSVICKTVMKQPDMYSCRVFALEFATSLTFRRNPFNEHYIIDEKIYVKLGRYVTTLGIYLSINYYSLSLL